LAVTRRIITGDSIASDTSFKIDLYPFSSDEETYLLALVRYIHLDPVRAQVVNDLTALDRYRWTGHAALMGKREQDWQHTDAVLSRFGRSTSTAVRRR